MAIKTTNLHSKVKKNLNCFKTYVTNEQAMQNISDLINFI